MPSSVIAGIEYDNLSHTLRITYVSGRMYDYKNVPERVYAAMKVSVFKGNISQ